MSLNKPCRILVSSICAMMLITTLVTNSLGWNKPGHMTTGAIAFAELRERDPIALRRVMDILNCFTSPQFRTNVTNAPPGTDRGLALFVYAARWPDDIRNTSEDRPPWHFTNRPFKPAGQPASVVTAPPAAVNIETAFAQNMRILQDEKSWGSDKAIALAWIFHLTGDGHQPLHATALFSTTFPQGDRGGTRFFVRMQNAGSTVDLHGVWDDAVLNTPDNNFGAASTRAAELRNKFPRNTINDLNEDDFPDWITESFELAKSTTYQNGQLIGSLNPNNGSVLPGNYMAIITPRAERRLVMAGYRLSDLLSRLF